MHTARYARLASASRAWNPATPIIVPELRSKTSKTQVLGDGCSVGRQRAAQSSRDPSRHRANPASVSAPKFGRSSSSRRISPARASNARSGRRKSRRSERTTAPSDEEVAPAEKVEARSDPDAARRPRAHPPPNASTAARRRLDAFPPLILLLLSVPLFLGHLSGAPAELGLLLGAAPSLAVGFNLSKPRRRRRRHGDNLRRGRRRGADRLVAVPVGVSARYVLGADVAVRAERAVLARRSADALGRSRGRRPRGVPALEPSPSKRVNLGVLGPVVLVRPVALVRPERRGRLRGLGRSFARSSPVLLVVVVVVVVVATSPPRRPLRPLARCPPSPA